MNICIIGYGTVGKAAANGFQTKLAADVMIIDPAEPFSASYTDLLETDFVFVCVPTPTTDNKQDISIIMECVERLRAVKYGGEIVIKSTVLPSNITKLIMGYPLLKISTNPEFLTARTASEDFLNQKLILLGCDNENSLSKLSKLYTAGWPKATVHPCSPAAAMMFKYIANVFFATKVGLMNEFYKACESLSVDWDIIRSIIRDHELIGINHTAVPGPDGHVGWGGQCFGKDIQAMAAMARELGVVHGIMDAVIKSNRKIRQA
jgi:UDPglucose 6-dehydrogenase